MSGPESFKDSTPIGADGKQVVEQEQPQNPNVPLTEQTQPSSIETFDSPVMSNEEATKKLEEMKKNEKSQVKKLDEEEVKEEKKVEDKKDTKEDEDDGKTDNEQGKDDDNGDTPEPRINNSKVVRLKDGEKATDVSLDATIPVKIKGKKEFVSLKELRDNYSGSKAWTEEISAAKKQQEEAKILHQKTISERDEIKGHLGKIASMLDDEKVDPLKPLMYLVEMSGRNVLDYTKKVYSHLSDVIHDFDDMDETERTLYWKDKELQFIKDNQATKREMSKQTEAQRERVAKIDQLRESKGVSEEQYVAAYDELSKLGYKAEQITPEAVVNYSVMKPHYEKAEGLCASYEEELTTDQMDQFVEAVARTSHSYPKLSEEDVLKISAKSLGWDVQTDDSDIEELNSKVTRKNAPTPPPQYKSQNGKIESFDDFDDEIYGRNYE